MKQRLDRVAINWTLLWAVVSCIVIFAATFAYVLYLRDQDLAKVEALAQSNKTLIEQNRELNERLADTAYEECVDRNARTQVATTDLPRFVIALQRDGARLSAQFWQGYLNRLSKVDIPPCDKPAGYDERHPKDPDAK